MTDTQPIGIGFLAVTHPHVYTRADLLSDMDDVRLVAVWDDEDDANAATFAERYSVERMDDVDELLARSDIDAVIVESWTQNMAGLAAKALRAGKKVLLEKPGGNTPAALRELAGVVDETDGYVTVGYMVRQTPVQVRLKALLADGTLGRVIAARFHVSVPAPDAITPWFNLETDIGGVLFEDGCHMIDLIIDLFGRPTSVTAHVAKYDDLTEQHGHRYEDAAACTLAWPDKVATLTLVGWEANEWLETWQLALYGERGTVEAGPLPERFAVFVREAAGGYAAGWNRHEATQFNVSWLDHEAKHVWHAVQHRAFYRAELQRFIADIRSGNPAEIPVSHALDIVETIQALYTSSAQGRTVTL
ncbi:MAG: Gfo/Idh/MocA family oxidoreductase [Candidatus Nanopelagicales bacterium]|nr:Gfo/Idh/MocA family oxidoreductase [Candidatus Nanopelagicales bacterium]MCF8536393.1 Gfo/Idh/MocA family oxidoreductase [Candidatus Nanopelagicales bacterium]MCF8541527.1 Gfo/Idh/MocA family oxidoreductase [Candidatus Nanopelagicales bacterium]MCF8557083.1 Gfo/Idh/MocA family oxidoreductase [Candidatus Nanopelagicales bacterium]